MAKPETPRNVTIVVVNYNGEKNLERCLNSILESIEPDAELLVVDNASKDSSLKILTELSKQNNKVKVVYNKTNVGYAGAINCALKYATGKYIAVLNMDLLVEKGWLRPLVSFLDDNPSAAVVNPVIMLMDKQRVNAAGQNIHVTGLGFNSGLGETLDTFQGKPFVVSGFHGCAFVIRLEVLKEIGGFDESGFLYHEDVNMSWLVRMQGYELYCVPSSIVYHDYFLTMYPAKFYLLERNRVAMLFTYLKYSTLLLISPLLIVTEIMAWGFSLLRGAEFLIAKGKSYSWVVQQRKSIARRRIWAQQKRTVSDFKVLSAMCLQYGWAQLKVLGRERGKSSREPEDGLATD